MDCYKDTLGRFAPSPSGVLHLGNIMSCLLAYLDAKSAGGKIVFRLEDLDPDRSFNKYSEQIADDLHWLGFLWDKGWNKEKDSIYAQSNRSELYNDIFDLLLKRNMVYPCYCSRRQRLVASAPHSEEFNRNAGCRCRFLTASERRMFEAEGRRPAWKIKAPYKTIKFSDLHYGTMYENLSDSGDFIIKRSDGVFAYQLAVSFDDMDMGITRVVRGRDLLSSTAKQIWLINELGGKAPDYCHAPLLVNSDKRKLSKRNGDLSMDILKKIYSPEEIIGHLAYLLRLTEDKPISVNELINVFDWNKVPINDIILR